MPSRAVHLLIPVVVAVTVAMLTSCSSSDGPVNTITQQEANNRAEQYILDAVASLQPAPRLEILARYEDSPCDDPSDHGPRGRVFVSRAYWLRDVPRQRNTEVIDTLVKWWVDHNFVITSDKRPKANLVFAESKTDSFRMSVQESSQGDLSIGTDSPCVWPNGTPAPKP
jgi:hypothetical protein